MGNNPTGIGGFKPGVSGNPGGRPKKSISTALNDVMALKGKRAVAKLVKQAVTEGRVIFPDGREMQLNVEQWHKFVDWLYTRLDGAPKTSMDIDMPTAAGHPIFFAIVPPGTDNEPGEEQ